MHLVPYSLIKTKVPVTPWALLKCYLSKSLTCHVSTAQVTSYPTRHRHLLYFLVGMPGYHLVSPHLEDTKPSLERWLYG